MAYTKGTAISFDDLLDKIISYVTNVELHGNEAWELKRKASFPDGTIFKCPGRKDGEFFYIGILTNKIKIGETYRRWLLNEKTLSSTFVWEKTGLNHKEPFTIDENGKGKIVFENGDEYSFPYPIEIFISNASVMHFNIFKQYDKMLEWAEQPGGIKLNKTTAPLTNGSTDNIDGFGFPLPPGTGCPCLSAEYEDKPIDYWLIKNKSQLIIVIKNDDKWDCASIGFFEPYDNGEYAFPATIIGGTSGATKATYYGYEQLKILDPIGLWFDYKPDNWRLVHGNPIWSTAAIDSELCPTQVAIMRPDGVWKYAANWIQGTIDVDTFSYLDFSFKYLYYSNPMKRPQNIKYMIRPGERNLDEFSNIDEKTTDTEYIQYKLEPIEIVERGSTRGVQGRIPNLSYSTHKIYKYGETILNGKKHLILPNVFSGRYIFANRLQEISIKHINNKLLRPEEAIEEMRNGIQNSISSYINSAERANDPETMNMIIRLED